MTHKQKQVYDFIRGYMEGNGVAPSYQEIGEALGIRSVSTVHKHLKNLEKRGFLLSPWGSGKRVLSLSPDGPGVPGGAVSLPLLGEVIAGLPIEAIEAPEEIEVPESLLPHAY